MTKQSRQGFKDEAGFKLGLNQDRTADLLCLFTVVSFCELKRCKTLLSEPFFDQKRALIRCIYCLKWLLLTSVDCNGDDDDDDDDSDIDTAAY